MFFSANPPVCAYIRRSPYNAEPLFACSQFPLTLNPNCRIPRHAPMTQKLDFRLSCWCDGQIGCGPWTTNVAAEFRFCLEHAYGGKAFSRAKSALAWYRVSREFGHVRRGSCERAANVDLYRAPGRAEIKSRQIFRFQPRSAVEY